MTQDYTEEFSEVQAAERERIDHHRRNRGDESNLVYGLALSGGGIRSASFALGVLQALDQHGLLRLIDYLSTVSGGGYIGSSLSWFMRSGKDGQAGRKTFPFGKKGLGVRSGSAAAGSSQSGELDPNAILSFIRQHGNYLNPRTAFRFERPGSEEHGGDTRRERAAGIGVHSLVAVLIRNMLLCLLVYGSLLVALFAGLRFLGARLPELLAPVWPASLGQTPLLTNTALLLAALLVLVFVALSVIYPIATWVLHRGEAAPKKDNLFARYSYRVRLWSQSVNGKLLFWIVALLVLGSVPWVGALIRANLQEQGIVGAVSAVVGAIIGFVRFRNELTGSGEQSESVMSAMLRAVTPLAAAFLLVYGLLLLADAVAATKSVWLVPALVGAGVLIGFTFGINYIGVNRLYRDRLMETFLPDDDAVIANEWRPAREADTTRLHEICDSDTCGPYHIINTNLNTVDSEKSKYRGRGGDSMVLSSLYCGSDATGWISSESWMGGGLSLAAAMAISGAAANPNTGVSGRGLTRNRLLSVVMALLNLRLGYFAQNPNPEKGPRSTRIPPNLLYPGLKQGVLGRDLNGTSPFVELTDGGHFENLGLYELVRRRADVIIVSDAGADPELSFSDLAYAAERIRVDFGVNLRMSKEFGLEGILKGSAGEDPIVEKYDLSQRGYFLATIEYPAHDNEPERHGALIYIKSTMIRDVPADVLGYKDRNEQFPDQSTADQFFDEEQFEAYRELGYRITDQAVNEITATDHREHSTPHSEAVWARVHMWRVG